jgi:hypothetical protein
VLAGRSALADDEARAAGFAEVHALTHLEPDVERCQLDASTLLVSLARRLAETSPQFHAAAERQESGDKPTPADLAQSC